MKEKTLRAVDERTLDEVVDVHGYAPNCPSLAVLREQAFDLLDLLSAKYQIENKGEQETFYAREMKRYIAKYSDNGRKLCSFPVSARTLAYELVAARLVTSPENILKLTEEETVSVLKQQFQREEPPQLCPVQTCSCP